MLTFLEFDQILAVAVDDLCILMFDDSLELVFIAQMNMPEKPEFGMKFIQKLFEARKTLMGIITEITIAFDRGVGHDDVDITGFMDLVSHLLDPSFHLQFGVLIFGIRISNRAA